MTPIICTDVERHKDLPLYTVKVYDIDHPVNFHSYDCFFYEQGLDLNDLLEKAKERIKEAEKVCKWLNDRIGIDQKIEIDSDGEPLADSYIAYCIARQNAADTIIKDLRKAMEE